MNKILVTNKNTLYIDPDVVFPSGSKQTVELKFEFQKKWDENLTLIAIFKNECSKPYAKVLNNSVCLVPYEVLSKVGELSIKLIGVLYNTNYVYIGETYKNNKDVYIKEINEVEYKDNLEYSLELTEKTGVAISCLPYINLLKLFIDDTEVKFEDLGNIKNSQYKLYSTIDAYDIGQHKIAATFDILNNGVSLNEDKVIENLSNDDIFSIIKSTIQCTVKVM